jgi:hypothetical protein
MFGFESKAIPDEFKKETFLAACHKISDGLSEFGFKASKNGQVL